MPLCLYIAFHTLAVVIVQYGHIHLSDWRKLTIIASERCFCTSCILCLFPFCLVFFKAFENFHPALICKSFTHSSSKSSGDGYVNQSRELSSLGLVWWFSTLSSH